MNLSDEQAGRFALVTSEAFRKPVQGAPRARSLTMLEVLQAGIVRQLDVLDAAGRTNTAESPVKVPGGPGVVLAEKLTGHLVR